MSALLLFGLNHETADLALRERLAFPAPVLTDRLASLRRAVEPLAPEQAILSTCNRTELVLAVGASSDVDHAEARTLAWLAEQGQLDPQALRSHLYVHRDADAAEHIFRVAAGLDSMVLGEPQILGQLKDAARDAQAAGSLGPTLHQLFQSAFACAKEVRTHTAIGSASVSLASAGVRLAQQIFGQLSETRMLFIGAGEMIQLCLAHFAAQQPQALVVCNRTLARAEALAAEHGGSAMPLSLLPERLHEFDVVVSCTASTLPILGSGLVGRALKRRKHRPMFLADLAVPRDIEAEVRSLADAFLFTIDDFSALVSQGTQARRDAAAEAMVYIERAREGFVQRMASREQLPLIKALGQYADGLVEQEVAAGLRRLSPEDRAAAEPTLQGVARGVVQKLLHGAYAGLNDPRPEVRSATAAQVQALLRLDGFSKGSE